MGNTITGSGGSYGRVGYGPELQCCRGVVDPITLVSVLAGIGAISFVLRQAAINNIKAGKRRKREIDMQQVDIFLKGLEEFENKVDQMSEGQRESSWISRLNNRLDGTQAKDPDELQTIDEMWGLAEASKFLENSGYDFPKTESIVRQRHVGWNRNTKGDTGDVELDNNQDSDSDSVDETCDKKFLRCLSKAVGTKNGSLKEPNLIAEIMNQDMLKDAMEGKLDVVWKNLMSNPKVLLLKNCMERKSECRDEERKRLLKNLT